MCICKILLQCNLPVLEWSTGFLLEALVDVPMTLDNQLMERVCVL